MIINLIRLQEESLQGEKKYLHVIQDTVEVMHLI
jgi:hypothetical protein